MAIIREAILGATMGFGFGLFLLPTRIAGAWVGQEMGLTMASLADPAQQGSVNIVGQLFEALGVLIFFALDVHHILLTVVNRSFERWPAGHPLSITPGLLIMDSMGRAHGLGLLLAAPIGVCLFLTIIVLAVLTKASPQLNLFSVGLTVRLVVGLTGMFVFLPDLCRMIQTLFLRIAGFFVAMLEIPT